MSTTALRLIRKEIDSQREHRESAERELTKLIAEAEGKKTYIKRLDAEIAELVAAAARVSNQETERDS